MRVNSSCLKAALLAIVAGLGAYSAAWGAQASPIVESARQIPVVYDVDIAVVGGGTGAVAAAVAAAQSGAKVFLAAPRPYLGEDLCATMRLWLEEGETPESPLARQLFSPEALDKLPGKVNSLPFTYRTSLRPAAPRHLDPGNKILNDGAIGMANHSVQYDGDVAITADLGVPQVVKEARIVMFYRAADFGAQSVSVKTSSDGKAWQDVATVDCQPNGELIDVIAPVGASTRYARFEVKQGEKFSRVLVGEIMLTPEKVADAPSLNPRGPFRPIHIKKVLDDALLNAKVQFLYGCYPTELLRDAQGNLCGIVMANRAGRQAVRAKVIIDATDRAWVARMAGAQFQPYPVGPQEFKYVVIGGQPQSGDGIVTARPTGFTYLTQKTIREIYGEAANGPNAYDPLMKSNLIEYTLRLPMADGTFASFARAEQRARDLTWNEAIQFNTDEIFQVPPDPMKGGKSGSGEWTGVAALALEQFQPAGLARMFVLGGCADLPREQAARLLRPLALMAMGERIGTAAASQARSLGQASEPVVAATTAAGRNLGEVKELLVGVRPSQRNLSIIASPQRTVPVIGEYDVVVIGGGTGGAPAGIGAGRAKARTLVIEYLHGLGGVGTVGLISKYYFGYIKGFTKEVPGGSNWNPLHRAEWWRKTVLAAGSELWFGAIGCGALVENGKLKGVVVVTPQGRGVVLAKTVIDATGNADIAAAAGAQTIFVNASEPAVQGTGLPPIRPGSMYTNTDFTIVDDSDVVDTWHVMVYAKNKYFNTSFDMGQLIDTRERRRIVGDFFMTLTDQINKRTYPDTICIARSNFDTHGMTVDPYLLLDPPHKGAREVNIPYRCLLPKGLDGILVTGLAVSAHRDAMPLIRMEPDIQNQGYAAGLIAATVAQKNQSTREVDLPAIQKQLVKMDNVPESVLGAKDSYPLPASKIAEAVKNPVDSDAMAVIVSHARQAMPLLRQAYADASSGQDKLNYARIMAVLRDPIGVDQLVAEVDHQAWDKGWNYTGGGQFGSSMSPLDMLIVAMARTGDKRCLAPVLRKVEQLNDKSEFSHFRTVALALEMIGDPTAAEPLARLLAMPGVRGHVTTEPSLAAKFSGPSAGDNTTRSNSIRELTLARALYRCGDKDGLGQRILTEYTHDLRGYLAQHAQAVLDGK